MAKAKILFVAQHGFIPRLDNFTEYLIGKKIDETNEFKSIFLTGSKENYPAVGRYNGILTFRFPLSFYSTKNTTFFLITTLISFFINGLLLMIVRPELVVFSHLRSNVFTLSFLCKVFKIKFVFTEHGILHDEYLTNDRDDPLDSPLLYQNIIKSLTDLKLSGYNFNSFKKFFRFWPWFNARSVIFWSKHNKFYAEKLGIISERISIVPCLVDFSRLESQCNRQILKKSDDSFFSNENKYVFFIGQLKKRKGWMTVLQVAKHAKTNRNYSNLRFIMCTSSTGEKEISFVKKYIEDNGLENYLRFIVSPSNEERNFYYKICDIYLMPSLYEGFGLPALEAGWSESIVVASNIPALNEFLSDGVNSFLFRKGDHLDCIAKLNKAIDLSKDQRDQIIRSMKETCNDHDIEHFKDIYPVIRKAFGI